MKSLAIFLAVVLTVFSLVGCASGKCNINTCLVSANTISATLDRRDADEFASILKELKGMTID